MVALAITAFSVAAAHGLPASDHAGMDHDGGALQEFALACLAIVATVAVAAARPYRPVGARMRTAYDCISAVLILLRRTVPPARAGPSDLQVLLL